MTIAQLKGELFQVSVTTYSKLMSLKLIALLSFMIPS